MPSRQQNEFHQIWWITECGGNPTFTIDFNDHTLRENQIVIIYPGQNTRIDLEGKKGYLLLVGNDLFFEINQIIHSNYLNGYFSNFFVTTEAKTNQSLTTVLSLMLDEYNELNREILMRSYQ